MAPTKSRVVNKKRKSRKCCPESSSSSSTSSSSFSESSCTVTDSCSSESSDCDCSDSDCSDCWECECVPQRKRGGKHKKVHSPKVRRAVDRAKKNKKHARRPKYASSSDESCCGSSGDCYECEPVKPGRKARH